MPIENVGGNYLPRPPETQHARIEAPDNYPSYGDKSGGKDVIGDTVTLCTANTKPDAAAEKKEQKETGADTQAPDNYPSYGDKGAEAPAKKAECSIVLAEVLEPSDYYLAKAPDNYPSYGDK